MDRISPGFGRDPATSALAPPDPPAAGPTTPRLETPLAGGPSYGSEVAALVLEHLGMTLMPWQVHAISGQLEHDESGDLIHRRSLVSVARQNGKTVALTALVLWR
ncbi:MAG: hypothetical protein EXQ74_04600 [Thermoleophilia bacterium]|nr:hypothetical protein [Thermoleophilia bacterium]